jgi:hypothetical protein
MALMYLCFSLLAVPVGLAMVAVYPQGRSMGLFLIFAPIIYAVVGNIGCALFGVLYNFIASRVGGVEFESVDRPGAA